MVRGLYNIHDVEASKQARKADSSYKSCLLTMFIVFLLCVIIFLLLWRTRSSVKYYPEDEKEKTSEKLSVWQQIGTPPPYEVLTEDITTTTTTTTKSSANKKPLVPKKTTTTTTHKPITKQPQFEKYRHTSEKTTTSSQQTPTTTTTTTSSQQTSTSAITTTATTTSNAFIPVVHTYAQKNKTSTTHSSTGTTPITETDEEDYDFTEDVEFGPIENFTGSYQNPNDRIVLSTTASTISSTTTPVSVQQTSIITDSSEESTTSNILIGGIQTSFNGTTDSSTVSPTTPTSGVLITSTDDTTHSSTSGPIKSNVLIGGSTATTSVSETESTTDNSYSDTDIESTTDNSYSDTDIESTTDNSYSDTESTADQSANTVSHVPGLMQTTPTASSSQLFNTETTTFSSGIPVASSTTATSLNSSSTTVHSQTANLTTSVILNGTSTTLSIASSTDSSSTSSSTTPSSGIILIYGSNTTTTVTTIATTETTITSDDETTDLFSSAETTELFSSSTQSSTTTANDIADQAVCETTECKVLTSRILSLMNHSIDPCDNFYEFACGALRNNPTLLQDYPEQDVWRRISAAVEKIDNTSYVAYQKFHHFYEQCVDYEHSLNRSDRLVQARKVVRDIDLMYSEAQWKTEKSHFNLTDMLVKMFKINSAPLFDVLLDVDTHDPSKFQLKLTVPPIHTKLQLESPIAARCKATIVPDDPHKIDMDDIYNRKYQFCTRHFGQYIDDLETAVKELELFEHTDDFYISQTTGYAKFFVEYDVFSLFENVAGWELKSNVLEKKFMLMTVEELNTYYPGVEWNILFQSLLNTDSIGKDTPVQVYFQEEYFNKLFDKLNVLLTTDNDTMNLHNGLLAMLAHDLYEDLIKPQPCNREEYCLRIASGLMEDIASSLYLSTFTKDELSERQFEMETLFHQLKEVLKDNVLQASWLDHVSRSAIVNKIDKMTVNAHGGNAFFNNTSFLNNQLTSNDLKKENSFLENSIQLLRRYRNILYNLYEGDPADDLHIWTFFMLPFDTHPSAVYQLNTVIIPFGMTGSWKQSKDLPSYVLKAQIGNEIGRHIIHHFDTAGIQYGASGKDPDLLTDYPKENYNAAYDNCEANFDDYSRSWTNQHNQTYVYKVNALRTMNEHITDNSALWLTHKLFNKSAEKEPLLPWLKMNHDQLYFLLAAQEFCAKAELYHYSVQMHESEQLPPYLRVDSMVQNSPVFGHVYRCGLGGKQNPVVKCSSFPEMEDQVYDIPNIGSV